MKNIQKYYNYKENLQKFIRSISKYAALFTELQFFLLVLLMHDHKYNLKIWLSPTLVTHRWSPSDYSPLIITVESNRNMISCGSQMMDYH